MRSTVVYVGDELGAAGYRLAGAQVIVPAPGEEAAALDQARQLGWLVLLCAEVAGRIDADTLRQATSALSPLLLVVPDMQGQARIGDLAERLRAQLGLAA
jgi:vacuolar-type H+-ATPase subunit F/Vma7